MINNQMTDQQLEELIPSPDEQEEFGLLMSMALDNLLNSDEEEQLQVYVSQYPVLADEWQRWQELDRQFSSVPSAMPSNSFVEEFELRLLQQSRRRRLWLGVGIGSVALTLWMAIVAGMVSLGAYVLFGQAEFLTEMVHRLAYTSVMANNWLVSVSNALGSLVSPDQALGLGLLYLTVAVSMLAGWVMFLRRSIRPLDSSPIA